MHNSVIPLEIYRLNKLCIQLDEIYNKISWTATKLYQAGDTVGDVLKVGKKFHGMVGNMIKVAKLTEETLKPHMALLAQASSAIPVLKIVIHSYYIASGLLATAGEILNYGYQSKSKAGKPLFGEKVEPLKLLVSIVSYALLIISTGMAIAAMFTLPGISAGLGIAVAGIATLDSLINGIPSACKLAKAVTAWLKLDKNDPKQSKVEKNCKAAWDELQPHAIKAALAALALTGIILTCIPTPGTVAAGTIIIAGVSVISTAILVQKLMSKYLLSKDLQESKVDDNKSAKALTGSNNTMFGKKEEGEEKKKANIEIEIDIDIDKPTIDMSNTN